MTSTLVQKVLKGFRSQEWNVIGRGGTWAAAMRPLEEYVKRKVERAVKAEREACAKVCEGLPWVSGQPLPSNVEMAAAIRARGQK